MDFAESSLAIALLTSVLVPGRSFAYEAPAAGPVIVSDLRGNLSFDVTAVRDPDLKTDILSALDLGFRAADGGGRSVARVIADLRGNGAPRTIRFYSDQKEALPSETQGLGVRAFSVWMGPNGLNEMSSPPSVRTDIRIFLKPGMVYWDVVGTVWHELLHVTLNITHHQTTREGSPSPAFVNDAVWYTTMKEIMFDFPRFANDPVNGLRTELYDPESGPWD